MRNKEACHAHHFEMLDTKTPFQNVRYEDAIWQLQLGYLGKTPEDDDNSPWF